MCVLFITFGLTSDEEKKKEHELNSCATTIRQAMQNLYHFIAGYRLFLRPADCKFVVEKFIAAVDFRHNPISILPQFFYIGFKRGSNTAILVLKTFPL